MQRVYAPQLLNGITDGGMIVPDQDGGQPMEVNACILITHIVYL
jgi:hypothetical protein